MATEQKPAIVPGRQDIEDIAARLRIARTNAGISQAEVARRAGLHPSAVSQYESDRTPSAYNLRRLARALGVSQDWLNGGGE